MACRFQILLLVWLCIATAVSGDAGGAETPKRIPFRSVPVPSRKNLCAKILAQGDTFKDVVGSVPIVYPQGTPIFDPRDLKALENILDSTTLSSFLAEQAIAFDLENARRISHELPRGATATAHATVLGLEAVIDIIIPANREFLDPKTAISAAGLGYHPICYPPGPQGVPAFFNPAVHWIVDPARAAKRMKETSFAGEIQQTFRSNELSLTWNTDFPQVVRRTAEIRAAAQRGGLTPGMIEMYQGAFNAGSAYSVEVWRRVFVGDHAEMKMVAGSFGFTQAGLVTIEDGFTDLSLGKAWRIGDKTGGHWVDDEILGEDAGRVAILAIIDRMLSSQDLRGYQLRLGEVNALTNILDPIPVLRAQSVNALKELRRENRIRGRLSAPSGQGEINWSNW